MNLRKSTMHNKQFKSEFLLVYEGADENLKALMMQMANACGITNF